MTCTRTLPSEETDLTSALLEKIGSGPLFVAMAASNLRPVDLD